jgi:hypothetical protein
VDPGAAALPPFDAALADELEQAIRLKDPDVDDLPDAGMQAQLEVTGSPGPMLQETIAAVDRVFADLYSDAARVDGDQLGAAPLRVLQPA